MVKLAFLRKLRDYVGSLGYMQKKTWEREVEHDRRVLWGSSTMVLENTKKTLVKTKENT